MEVWAVFDGERLVSLYASAELADNALYFLIRNHPEKVNDYRISCEEVVR